MKDGLYAMLGFRKCRAEPKPHGPGFSELHGGSNVILDFTWRDRLRVLISGMVMVDIAHRMSHLPARWESTHTFSVLPPNYEG